MTTLPAQATQTLLRQIGWDVLAQSPHGPDLTPSDLFTRLKETLGRGKRFKNDEVYRFPAVTRDGYEVCGQNLIPQYRECIELDRNYVKNDDECTKANV